MLSETACKANAFGMTYLGEIEKTQKYKNKYEVIFEVARKYKITKYLSEKKIAN